MTINSGTTRMPHGFTLIEMTVVVTIGLMVAGISLTLFSSQLASYQILSSQNFLVSEAPQINNTLNRIVSRANFFQMYKSLVDAEIGQNAIISGGKILALQFEDPGNSSDSSYGVIAFNSSTNTLSYYHVNSLGGLSVASPQWNISTHLSDADFYVENGVLRIKLTGPNGEEIIYSTTTQR